MTDEVKDMVQITATPGALHVDINALRAALEDRLQDYETVVTADTLKDAKQAAADINKLKKSIADKRKAAVNEASADIRKRDEELRGLEKECDRRREGLMEQVRNWEAQQLEEVRATLIEARRVLWAENKVDDAFCCAAVDDLVKLTAVTDTGRPTAATYREISSRVKEDKAAQTRTENRLLQLKVRSYEAGLHSPLTQDHVSSFLQADDDTYERELQRILDAEVKRQEQAEHAYAEKAERERRRQDTAKMAAVERDHDQDDGDAKPTQEDTTTADPGSAPAVGNDGLVPWTVYCSFKTRVSPEVKASALKAEFEAVMAHAGITGLESVSVEMAVKGSE